MPSIFRLPIVASCAILTTLAGSECANAAPPTPTRPHTKSPEMRAIKDISGIENPFAVRSSSAPVCETTSFEADGPCSFELGFVCGSAYAGFCPASGPTVASCTGNPAVDQDCCSNFPNALNGWWVVDINEFCGSPNVMNVNPSEGAQHLRFTHDPLGGATPGCNGFADFACNPNALMGSIAVAPAVVSNVNYSYDIAMSAPHRLARSLATCSTSPSVTLRPSAASAAPRASRWFCIIATTVCSSFTTTPRWATASRGTCRATASTTTSALSSRFAPAKSATSWTAS